MAKEIQIVHDQQTVKLRQPVRPLTQTVTSHWWKLLEGVTGTQTISSWPKTHPQSRSTQQTSWEISVNWRLCMRSWRGILTQSHTQQCFSPTPTSSKFRSSPMPRPTFRKTTKTMVPYRWSTTIIPHFPRPWKTPQLPQLSLRHTHTSRPEMLIFKRKRKTSQTSAS